MVLFSECRSFVRVSQYSPRYLAEEDPLGCRFSVLFPTQLYRVKRANWSACRSVLSDPGVLISLGTAQADTVRSARIHEFHQMIKSGSWLLAGAAIAHEAFGLFHMHNASGVITSKMFQESMSTSRHGGILLGRK